MDLKALKDEAEGGDGGIRDEGCEEEDEESDRCALHEGLVLPLLALSLRVVDKGGLNEQR